MPCLISTGGHLLEFRKFPSRFGTYAENELVVQEGMGVAAHHFTLRREGVRIVLEATGVGLTTVNGNNVRRANIRDGDRIQVGQLMLIYSNPSGQQNHHPGRLDEVGPMALPSPTAQALPPATTASPPVAETSTTPAAQTPVPAKPQANPPLGENPTASPTLRDTLATFEQKPPDSPAASGPFPMGNDAHQVPKGIPTASETTPSDSFLAWAKAAEVENESPIAGPVSAAISAQGAASTATPTPEVTPAQTPAAVPQISQPASEPQSSPSNPFAEAALQAQVNPTSNAPVAATSSHQEIAQPTVQTTPVENPFADAADNDLAAIFSEPDTSNDGDDLANIFLHADDSDSAPPNAQEPAATVEIPDIPKISEAEKVGATAEATELPSKDINPIGSIMNKRKPAPSPPPPAVPVETKASEPAKKFSVLADRKSAKPKKSRKKNKETDSMAGRLTSSKLQPKYRLQIPWHKVAIFLCLIFAGAGAYLATSGQAHVDKYMAMLGLKSDPVHHTYLTRLADTNPNMILSADADKIVGFYRKWASEENWVTVGDLETKLKKWATGIRLSNLEHVSVATNDDGDFVALVSTKSNLNRQDLMRDLGRGVLVSERLGTVTIHEGFVGSSEPVKFAILNPKTMVIGDPDMVMQFVNAPVVTPEGPPSTHPTAILASSSKDLLGLYHTRNGLDTLADWFSGPLKPSIDRLLGFIQTEAVEESEFLAQIGGDLRVDATFSFDEAGGAETFANGWRERANRQLGIFKDLLGPKAPPSFTGAAKDLEQITITTPGNQAKLALSTTNRWATLGSIGLKDTLIHLVASLENRPVEQTPSLMTPEETRARALAQEMVERCSLAMNGNSKALSPGQNIAEVISLLSKGVRGSGVYRNISYRVPGADEMGDRLLQLLEWHGDELVMVVKDPPPPSPAMASKEEDGETGL